MVVELTGSDGAVREHVVSAGGGNTVECSARTVGLTLADGKRTLAGLQDHLVQAQTAEYRRQRRQCWPEVTKRPDLTVQKVGGAWDRPVVVAGSSG